jgi:hypothetical protein
MFLKSTARKSTNPGLVNLIAQNQPARASTEASASSSANSPSLASINKIPLPKTASNAVKITRPQSSHTNVGSFFCCCFEAQYRNLIDTKFNFIV